MTDKRLFVCSTQFMKYLGVDIVDTFYSSEHDAVLFRAKAGNSDVRMYLIDNDAKFIDIAPRGSGKVYCFNEVGELFKGAFPLGIIFYAGFNGSYGMEFLNQRLKSKFPEFLDKVEELTGKRELLKMTTWDIAGGKTYFWTDNTSHADLCIPFDFGRIARFAKISPSFLVKSLQKV